MLINSAPLVTGLGGLINPVNRDILISLVTDENNCNPIVTSIVAL